MIRNIYILLLLTFGLGQDYSLSFDGVDDYVGQFHIMNDFPLSAFCWFKTTDDMGYLMQWNESNDGNTGHHSPDLYIKNGYLEAHVWSSNYGDLDITSSSLVNDNNWHYGGFTHDSNDTFSFYLDGNLVGSIYNNNSGRENYLILGKYNTSPHYSGNIDEVAIWNDALTQSEIQTYMSTPPTGNEAGLVGYYKFNAGTGTTLYDHSGNGNHGTINGAQWAGCTDPLADNYLSDAELDDGSCEGSPVNSSDFTYAGEFDGHYYYTSNTRNNWYDSELLIQQNSGHQVSIGGDIENQFVYSIVSNLYAQDNSSSHIAYIGYVQNIESDDYSEPNGGWEWTNQEENLYINWLYPNPTNNNNNENCTEMEYSSGSSWNDICCDCSYSGGPQYTFYSILELEQGCTDSTAFNYQDYVYEDDGSCMPVVEGCTHPNATNYDETANVDDGSCEFSGDYSLSFDGVNDEVLFSNCGLGTGDNDFTMLFNFRTTDLNGVGHIINTGNRTETDFHIYYYQNNLYVGTYNNSQNQTQIPFSNYMDGNWYNIAVVWDGTSMKTYIGDTIAETITPPYNATDNTMIFGHDGGVFGKFQLDNVNIWNNALEQEEILSYIYNLPNGNEEALAGYYKFNAGSGNTLYDHSGNGNHGTLMNMDESSWIENIYGCTYPAATNYDETANVDDGSCTYPDNGDYSLSFDGVDDYVVVNPFIRDASSDLTINVYAKGKGTMTCPKTPAYESYFGYYNDENGNGIAFHLGILTPQSGHGWNVGEDLSTDYQFYTITLDDLGNSSTLAEVFLNGVSLGQHTYPYSIPSYSFMEIGRNIVEGNGLYDGVISEIQMWDGLLTEQEIIANMETSPTGNEEGLIGYWNFNAGEGETLYDHSGNGNHGTLMNMDDSSWVLNGCTDPCYDEYNPEAEVDNGSCETFIGCPDNGDYSLSFDGDDDWVDVSDNSSLPFGTSDFNISFKLKALQQTNNAFSQGGIINKYNNTGTNSTSNGFYVRLNSTNIQFAFKPAGSNSHYTDISTYLNNQWFDVSLNCTWGDKVRIYINGNLVDSLSIENITGTLYNSNPLGIGRAYDYSNSLDGNLDDIQIWNTTLTQQDIQSYMTTPPTGSEDGLVGYWKFNEGTGSTLYDHSANGNHGVLMNMDESSWVENIYGCTDSYADNYNPDANWDDGSCTYPDNGDYSLSFDGVDDRVDTDTNGGEISDGISFSCDFRTSQISTQIKLISQWGLNSAMVHLDVDNGYLRFIIRNDDTSMDIESFGGGIYVSDGEWHSASVTYDNLIDQVTWIIDGQEINEQVDNMTGMINSSENFTIGYSSNDSYPYYYHGKISNLKIWNAPIYDYNSNTNLLLSYKFNAGIGDTLYDHSGNGNHGAIHGAYWAGCTDENSCDYLPNAVIDDGSCATYPIDENHDCEGNCIAEGINLDEDGFDCLGDCGGDAVVDNCSTCDNDPTNDCIQDCNEDWGGSAYLDDCEVCCGGNSGYDCNSDIDECGVCFGDNSSCCLDDSADNYLEDGGCEYHYTIELHAGANLVSFWTLPEDNSLDNMFIDLDGIITGVIGEGTAAVPDDVHGWNGSLTEITCLSGYWITVSESVTLNIIGVELCPCDSVYEIQSGPNLVSWPSSSSCSVGDAIPDDFEPYITGIIGEGIATIPNETFGWSGSLTSLQPTQGYWLSSSIDMYYNWDACSCSGSFSRIATDDIKINSEYFNQSTKQAFYFLEAIENVEIGDWILSYNGDKVIGARQWQGSIIDVPAMGSDGSDYTKGYIETGEVPSFKILRGDELINLEGDIPAFENNQLYMVSSLTEAVALPETFSLDRAYPNPFNPTTTLSFAIPIDSEVFLSVYNLQGREVSTLINANMDAGYHTAVWDANSYASGVYFVKMVAGEYVNSQKLMLVK